MGRQWKQQRGLNLVSAQGTTLAKLYDTVVVVVRPSKRWDDGRYLYVHHGGFLTRSTTRAINAALEEANVKGKVSIRKSEMILEVEHFSPVRVETSGATLLI